MSRKPNNALAASHTLVCGGTGSGKTSYIRQFALPGARRVIAWDGKDELEGDGFERITSQRELVARIETGRALKLAFVAPVAQFGFWARCAYAWGHCTAYAEELADVTTPAKAPQSWGELIRKGRGHGLATISATQRPQEIDKTTVGNATDVVCLYLALGNDRKYMIERLGIPADALENLTRGAYIHRKTGDGTVTTGRVGTKPGANRATRARKTRKK